MFDNVCCVLSVFPMCCVNIGVFRWAFWKTFRGVFVLWGMNPVLQMVFVVLFCFAIWGIDVLCVVCCVLCVVCCVWDCGR